MKNKLIKLFVLFACMLCCLLPLTACNEKPSDDNPSDKDITPEITKTDITGVSVVDAVDGKISVDYTGEAIAVTYTGTETSLTVTYEGKDGTEYAKSETAPTDVGNYTVTVSFAGNDALNAFSMTVDLEIKKIQNDFEFTVADTEFGQAVTPTVTKNASSGAVTYKYVGINGTDYEESETAPTAIGEYSVTATVAATKNYYGARKSHNFTIESSDPLYGVPEEITGKLSSLTRVDDLVLTKNAGYQTNVDAKMTRAGVIKASGTSIMIESDKIEHSRMFILVKSSVKNILYARFAVNDGNTYETVVNDHTNYCKFKADIEVDEGYSLVAMPLVKSDAYVGKADAEVTGVHMLPKEIGDIEIIGIYYAPELEDSDVPASVMEKITANTKLTGVDFTLASPSYATNSAKNSWISNGNVAAYLVNGESQALELKYKSTIGYKMAFVVYAEEEVTCYFRHAVGGATGWADVVNDVDGKNSNLRFKNEAIIPQGYSVVEFVLTEYPSYSGSDDAIVTGVHMLFNKMGINVRVYDVYTEPLDAAPADKLAEMEGKTLLDYTLAPSSYATNENALAYNGTLMTSGTNMEVKANITSGTVYMLVHASKASTGYFRFAIEGKSGYDAIMNGATENVKYYNAVSVPEGYSILTINLAKYSEYTGDAGAKIGGFHINFWNDTLEYFNIFGVWQEPVEQISSEILAQVAEKDALTYTLVANGGYKTNSAEKVSQDPFSNYITSNGNNVALNITGVTKKVYIIMKSSAAATAYLRFGETADATYETYVNVPNTYSEYCNEILVAEGMQVLEVTLSKNTGYTGTTGGDIVAMYLQLSSVNYTIYGIYAEPSDVVPNSILNQVAGKTALTYSLYSAQSWDTNVVGKVDYDDSTKYVTASGCHLALNITGVTDKVYIIMKSSESVSAYLRFGIESEITYDKYVNSEACTKYFNNMSIEKGYKLYEITLGAHSSYTGAADASIVAMYLQFASDKPDYTICGIYVDAAE